jgi:tight adherence protein C
VIVLAIFALALAAVAVAAVLRSLTLPRTRIVARLDGLAAYGYTSPEDVVVDLPATDAGPFSALARGIGGLIARHTGRISEDDLRKELVAAGIYGTSPRTLLGYRVLAGAGVGLSGLALAGSPILGLLAGAIGAYGGWALPLLLVHRRASQRADAIDRELPNLIDQVVVTLEAGVGYSSSLQTAARRMPGPLGDEMRLTLQEQRMGVALTESLQHLRDRVDSPNVRSFARAVIQGERLGVSIGTVMRDLAIDMRKRRRQAAEEAARKAPVKILIPLVVCILPSLLIVVLAPALLQLTQQISGL